jgi:3-deoxy-7-phosphoheptulonate synthase
MNQEILLERGELPLASPPKELGEIAVQLSDAENKGARELKDRRIIRLTPIYSPSEVIGEIEQTADSARAVEAGRQAAENILKDKPTDDRLLVIVGPCSIHDTAAAEEYAEWIAEKRSKFSSELEIVMRAYLEKPRTTVGWKGFINDPDLNNTFHINKGLVESRKLLNSVTSKGVPVATELLDTSTPQYLADMISYGAIGARTTESQLHRELVSGVSFQVGFKNGTGGSIKIAIDAMKAAATTHSFIGIDKEGRSAIIETAGNTDTNLIMRGSTHGPNYHAVDIARAISQLKDSGQNRGLIVDVSHANSNKDYLAQMSVAKSVAMQISNGNRDIRGLMVESNLEEGSQKLSNHDRLIYGQSITDACIGLGDTGILLDFLADSVQKRRSLY